MLDFIIISGYRTKSSSTEIYGIEQQRFTEHTEFPTSIINEDSFSQIPADFFLSRYQFRSEYIDSNSKEY